MRWSALLRCTSCHSAHPLPLPRLLQEFVLPNNVRATTSAVEAIHGAQYAVHAVPVQSSRAFLVAVKDILDPKTPIICVSKGLEVGTTNMMSEVISSALGRKQPAVFLSGPSFAKEVMQGRPTGLVAASRDPVLAKTVQALLASHVIRVNTSSDVVGVEICGALKNVLAIGAGIVEGLDLGHNAMAAFLAQGCAEIRWAGPQAWGMGTDPNDGLTNRDSCMTHDSSSRLAGPPPPPAPLYLRSDGWPRRWAPSPPLSLACLA